MISDGLSWKNGAKPEGERRSMGFENDGSVNENSVEDIVLRYRPELDKIVPYFELA